MTVPTKHYLIIGDCTKTKKILDLPAIDLLVTSPPYFNAPFDYEKLFQNYESFLEMIAKFGELYFKALRPGGVFGLNIDDMLIEGIKYPIISDVIKIFLNIGYKLKGKIIWRKPEGYIRISRRSGVLLQNPYPMYYYPDNLLEIILIFQKAFLAKLTSIKTTFFEDIWEITNVLPLKGRLETDIAAFPDELPKRLIKIFTKEGSWVCDPFLGSGTTMKVARELKRHSIGVEILENLIPIIRKKSGFTSENLSNYFGSDQLIIENLLKEERVAENKQQKHISSHSFISQALKGYKSLKNDYKHHFLLLDCRNIPKIALHTEFTKLLDNLFPGRILAVLFESLNNSGDNTTLNQLFDLVMQHGLRLRDKITVQHRPEGQWKVINQFASKIVFHHCYYEILLFQKGKFDYKSKSKQEKQDCLIDKKQFQKEKWYLTLWDFRNRPRKKCDYIVSRRLLELFLFNDEVVGSNISQINCPKRRFTLDYYTLIQS
ncbi:MAG: DNA-methyltransferase [Candidatus Hodarchaeales archaeon]|jgi:site-specific DNA-methyltransferase (adenine-specific)